MTSHDDPDDLALERVAALLREARERDRAPAELRARIEAMRTPAPRRSPARWTGSGRARRPLFGGGLAVALAALIVALVLVIPGGSPGGPSVAQAAQIGLLPPAGHAAPARLAAGEPYRLQAHVDGLAFPSWINQGLTPSGQRRDRLGSHSVLTVFYRGRGSRLAYSIVSTPALRGSPARGLTGSGYAFRVFQVRGRTAITWRALGHTCVMSAVGMSAAALERLVDGSI